MIVMPEGAKQRHASTATRSHGEAELNKAESKTAPQITREKLSREKRQQQKAKRVGGRMARG